ncbi:VOC family protein [Candidatus Berkiella aquae]|uniref:VOC family protein n=1 Tax=Candidatus Berkiella aquae TaxID=295108 RepID=A0A0Q9YY71_9GAMM|nr:VOC family protein [Candidatus Berkiella aquae]MCS5711615.1 VOC family protein [Candidatus Berkiella aquae]
MAKKASVAGKRKLSPAKKTTAVKKKRTVKKVVVKSKRPSKPKKKVLTTPKGYSSVTPYLIIDKASKAIDYYQKIFGAKVVMRMEKPGGKIGHAELKIGDSKIMLADEFPDMGACSPRAFGGCAVSIHLYTKNVDDVVKRAVAGGAKLLMPVMDMFYGDRSGSIEDPFGHRWYISTHIEDVTPATMRKRAAELYAKKK